jgi:hypothetical protein
METQLSRKKNRKSQSQKSKSRSRSRSPTEIIIGKNGIHYVSTELPNEIHPLPNAKLDKKIFKIEYELADGSKCVNYVDDGNKHVVFKDKNGIYVLFHIHEENISEDVIILCKDKLKPRTKSKKSRTTNSFLSKDIIILESCRKEIDLTKAQEKIKELNIELRKKCPDLFLKIAPYYDFLQPMYRYGYLIDIAVSGRNYETLILALCNEKECISTIEILINSSSGEISINSKTDPKHEGNKYNKLLRCVLIIVALEIKGFDSLQSASFNPISAWLLQKYSNASIKPGDKFEEYLKNENVSLGDIDQSFIKNYYKGNKKIDLIIPINEKNALKSQTEFQKIIASEIRC